MSVAHLPRSRFPAELAPAAGDARGLRPDHPALAEERTIFPTTVIAPADAPRLLVSGANQRKLGDRVTKGPWAGMPIYCLTLEERATCPTGCHNWAKCYGNSMPWSRRLRHGPDLEDGLHRELAALQLRHRAGFVVRLHILGDFYSVAYVERWAAWLDRYPALRVFGFTAWPPSSPVGAAVARLADERWDRFAIRLSSTTPGPSTAITIDSADDRAGDGIICPAQTGAAASCGSCGLCWSATARPKAIFFLTHGMRRSAGPRDRGGVVVGSPTAMTKTNAPDATPAAALVAALDAEAKRLVDELRQIAAFRQYEAVKRLLRLYLAAPQPAAAERDPAPVDRAAVLRRIAAGADNREVAAEFGISAKRVQGFRMGNRHALARMAVL